MTTSEEVAPEVNKYRLVRVPKQNFSHEIKVEIQEDTKKELSELFEIFATKGKLFPKALRKDLVSIGIYLLY